MNLLLVFVARGVLRTLTIVQPTTSTHNHSINVHAFPNVSAVPRMHLCLMNLNCLGKRSFLVLNSSKESSVLFYQPEKTKFISSSRQ